MELVRALGARGRTCSPDAVDVDWLLAAHAHDGPRRPEGVAVEIGLPTRAQAALISPSAPACVARTGLEGPWLGALRRGGVGGRVVRAPRRRCHGGAAASRARAGRRGTCEVPPRYSIAADGARSAVREALGIPMHGSDDVLGAVTALFRAPLWDVVGDRRYGIYATLEPGRRGHLPPVGAGRPLGLRPAGGRLGGRAAPAHGDEMLTRLRRSPACRACRWRSSGSGGSRRPPAWRSGSARGRCS